MEESFTKIFRLVSKIMDEAEFGGISEDEYNRLKEVTMAKKKKKKAKKKKKTKKRKTKK
tara:strand:+ start:189 stop:365 length:177 start_codon:yes stop_codon:yes gene_type:complete